MAAKEQGDAGTQPAEAAGHTNSTQALRIFSWVVVVGTFGFLLNNYLVFWHGWSGVGPVFRGEATATGLVQAAIYALCIAGPALYVRSRRTRTLREDAETMTALSAYVVRSAFWMVLFVGLADMVISFLRVEGFLEGIVGADLTRDLGRSQFRGPYVHMPLVVLALVVGAFTRTLGFTWLALLVVLAELQIVITRFIFSYEQAFQGDLVRFWYAALFLFASAYTLIEEGHVRVDVLYSGFAKRTRGFVNGWGSLLLGISLCVVILAVGHESSSSIVNGPLLNFEVSQSGFGMYVKYMMAGFLSIFAISMMIQFAAYMLESAADARGDPGGREIEPELVH